MSRLDLKKLKRKFTGRLAFMIMPVVVLCFGFLIPAPIAENEAIDKIFVQQLKFFLSEMNGFEKAVKEKFSPNRIKASFRSARIAYKKAAILIDYYYPLESRLLNAAPLPSAGDDPRLIFEPHGFQVIEEMVFVRLNDSSRAKTLDEIDGIQKMIRQLLQQPNRSYKFKNNLVIDALRMSMIRLMTTGISGLDSPVANNSIEEATATLNGIKEILSVYQQASGILPLLEKSIAYTSTQKNFNRFDRLRFMEEYANGVYSALAALNSDPLFAMPSERYPVNPSASSLFSPDFFDAKFFEPSARFAATPGRIALGKKLFFDPILSSTKNRSCASCHQPEKAFTDGLKTALGVDERSYLSRNTPTLLNSGFQTRQFLDSRAALLEHQLNAVVHNKEEMGGSLAQSVNDLMADKTYSELFEGAYAQEQDKITQYTIANAISSYVRSLVSFNSRFDLYMRGDRSQLNKEEREGFNIFMGKAKCGTCHFMPLFNGLAPPTFTDTESEVLGVPANKNPGSPIDPDGGKYQFTGSPIHRYAFKTPTLRNIGLTAPYMHNGVYDTLEEVMEFYNNGGGKGLHIAPENQTLPFDQLKLSKKDIKAVIAFMKTLTDHTIDRP